MPRVRKRASDGVEQFEIKMDLELDQSMEIRPERIQYKTDKVEEMTRRAVVKEEPEEIDQTYGQSESVYTMARTARRPASKVTEVTRKRKAPPADTRKVVVALAEQKDKQRQREDAPSSPSAVVPVLLETLDTVPDIELECSVSSQSSKLASPAATSATPTPECPLIMEVDPSPRASLSSPLPGCSSCLESKGAEESPRATFPELTPAHATNGDSLVSGEKNANKDLANWEVVIVSDLDSEEEGGDEEGELRCYGNKDRTICDEPAVLPDFMDPTILQRINEMDIRDDASVRQRLGDDSLVFDWRADASVFQGVREAFIGEPGPTFPVEELTSPLAALRKFLTDEFIELIVDQTNLYAEQLKVNPNVSLLSRLKRWSPVTKEEMWVFLGIIILQGLYPFAVEKEYWTPVVEYIDMSKFKELMSYNRFQLLKKCLHFADNTKLAADCTREDMKLYKIQPVVDYLNDRFRSLYYPAQEVVLDESLLLWKGRLGMSQKIAKRAAEAGVKSLEIYESATGYMWAFKVCSGKGQVLNSEHVYELAYPLLGMGHTVILDNSYNSPLLSRALKSQGTDTTGTLRVSRQYVPESLKRVSNADMLAGEYMFSQTRDLTITLWRDSSLVAFISTFHKAHVGGKEKNGRCKNKPEVLLDYNKAMGVVDRKDRLLSAFPMERMRNLVWYKKFFRRLLNVSVANSAILYARVEKMASRKFRQLLIREIMSTYRGPLSHQIPKMVTVFDTFNKEVNTSHVGKVMRPTLVGGHYPEKGASNRARCKFCPSRTSWRCNVCKIALCAENCFSRFHTN